MLEADLAPLALELAAWGAASPAELAWLDAPPAAPYAGAVQLLRQLDALDEAGRITAHGRQMAALGLHPRLAHMLLRSRELGLGALGCRLAALLEERDLLKGAAGRDSDLRPRLSLVLAAEAGGRASISTGHEIDRDGLQRILFQIRQWEKRLAASLEHPASGSAGAVDESLNPGVFIEEDDPDFDLDDNDNEPYLEEDVSSFATSSVMPAKATENPDRWCGLLVSFAYPDRIASRRPDGRYLLRNGRGAILMVKESLGTASYLALADVDDEGTEGRILLAAPLDENDLYTYYRKEIAEETSAIWDDEAGMVRARWRQRLGAIVLKERPEAKPSPEQITKALLQAINEKGVTILPWNEKARKLQERLLFLHRLDDRWPDVSDKALTETAKEWLAPYLQGIRKRSDLEALSLYSILENQLEWGQQQELNNEAPTHLLVPSGSKIQIHYEGPQAPYAAVRLQEVFGMMATPRIGYGRVPITLHLLSPAGRPVQVTSDLQSFWQHTYFDVKKDLKGRYPKHYWPDDPLSATATRKVRPDR
ncbi:ATP-dependent helicase C-terminal domain-containing protein, partial [Paenibacillus puldeungensis]